MYNIVKETRASINLDNKEAKMSLLEGNTRVHQNTVDKKKGN